MSGRREIGIIAPHHKVASAIAKVFEQDWLEAMSKAGTREKEAAEEAAEPALAR